MYQNEKKKNLSKYNQYVFSRPALKNIHMFEFHPSLSIASKIARSLRYSLQVSVFVIQWSLTYPDPTYPDYSLIWTHVWEPNMIIYIESD